METQATQLFELRIEKSEISTKLTKQGIVTVLENSVTQGRKTTGRTSSARLTQALNAWVPNHITSHGWAGLPVPPAVKACTGLFTHKAIYQSLFRVQRLLWYGALHFLMQASNFSSVTGVGIKSGRGNGIVTFLKRSPRREHNLWLRLTLISLLPGCKKSGTGTHATTYLH